MTPYRLVLFAGLAIACAAPASYAQRAPKPSPAATAAAASAATSEVEPEAVQALTRMSAYLASLTAFELTSETSQDLLMTDGQKVRVDGVNHYTVRRPDAFVVEVATPRKVRKLYYDGKSLTLVSPELGYYATVEAPATIRATLDAANTRYGLYIPLQDLFKWTDPANRGAEKFKAAFLVGSSKVDGVEADQYAFRQDEIDWQIWIQHGEHPAPLKVVIIDRSDPSLPAFEAKLRWNTSPQLTADTFTYRPTEGAKAIKLATLRP